MKNIHILSTDKPSRLWVNNLLQGKLELSKEVLPYNTSRNIHITSDEEIKEGDWYISILENEVYKATKETQNIMSVANLIGTTTYKNTHFKIILTTDQDLIKDGVQAIDDEFLEWFVNNSSCEFVEINKKENLWFCCDFFEEGQENYCINSMPRCPKCNSALGGNPDWINYKIIIPKEEAKQETQGYICPHTKKQCDDECCVSAEDCHIEASFGIISDCIPPKQETLKEVAERRFNHNDNKLSMAQKIAFMEGAKWQQKRMYSEEEVYDILIHHTVELFKREPITLEDFWNKFKNK